MCQFLVFNLNSSLTSNNSSTSGSSDGDDFLTQQSGAGPDLTPFTEQPPDEPTIKVEPAE